MNLNNLFFSFVIIPPNKLYERYLIYMLINVILKSIAVYFIVLTLLKFMGKREIGQVSLFDFAIILIISDVLVFSIEEKSDKFWYYFICGLILTIIQRLISFIILKSRKLRLKFDGEESVIIYDGKLNVKEMAKQRYNMDDLILQLRLSNVSNLKEVKYLILENNGRISVFKYQDKPMNPFPLIVSGKIEYKNLKLLGISEIWLNKKLKEKNKELKDIYYASYDENDLYVIPLYETINN